MHHRRAGAAQIVEAYLAQFVALKQLGKWILDITRLEAVVHFLKNYMIRKQGFIWKGQISFMLYSIFMIKLNMAS